MAITLDDVVLEQMQTNEQLQIMHKTDLATFALERQGFKDLIEKQEEMISVITAETLRQSRVDRESAREESGSGGVMDGPKSNQDFRGMVGEAAAGGIGKGIGSVASLAGLAAGIVAFVGTISAGGALVKMMGIDFNGLKHMLVGVADAFAAADTFGLIKMAGFLALGGLAKLDAVNAGLFGASMAAFMLGLGAGGKILDVLGFDFSGLKNVLVNFADAFKAASIEGLIKMAGFLAVGAYTKADPKQGFKFGAAIAAFMLGLGAGGAIMDFFGMDFSGLKNVLVGLGEAFASMSTEGYIMLGVMAAATAMVGPTTMAKAGLGIAAFVAPLGIVGAVLGKFGGDGGTFGTLMKNTGDGLAAFGNIKTIAALLILGTASALLGPVFMGLIGLGISAFLLGIAAGAKVISVLGADGSTLKTLMENIAGGINSFSEINFKNLLLMGPAMVSVAAGLTAFMAGSVVAGIGNFIKTLIPGGRGKKSSLQVIAEDLAHLNEIDFKNLTGMSPVAFAINKMADAIEKLNEVMDDIDDDLFERLKEMLSGASFTVASEAPVRTFTGRKTSEPRTQLGVDPTTSTNTSSSDTLTDVQRARISEVEGMSRAEYRQLSSYDKREYQVLKAQQRKEDGQDASGLGVVPSVSSVPSYTATKPTSSNPQDMEIAELGVTFRNAEEARKAFEASDASFETFVDPDDIFGDERRRYTDPKMQAEYERLLEQEKKAIRAYRRAKDSETGTEVIWKVKFLQDRGVLPQNVSGEIPGYKIDEMVDNYFANLAQPSTAQPSTPPIETPPRPKVVAKKQASIPSDSVGDERLVSASSDEQELERLRRRNKGTYDIYVPSYENFQNDRDRVSYEDFNRFGGDYDEFRKQREEDLLRNNKEYADREARIKILEDRINALEMQPTALQKPPIDTAATEFVQRDALANVTNSQAAPNVVIQDNSVNSSSQSNTTVSNKPPMPSPLNNNRTRANAYAMV